ncbi:DinB family protein [Arthrobacter citreus]|uniref:DinB family protein n=1 Tax=Arthrobacter citreus TaxID=1670 RepID=UPI0036DAB8BE
MSTFIDEHRSMLAASLDGLTEEEARLQLVPTKTTLLGLVKHAAFVERVWFCEAVTGASRAELGIPATPDESFDLQESDTIESVLADYAVAVTQSRKAVAAMDGDTLLPGNRRGPLPLRWVQQHVLRELAQHCGHADILRELILAARSQPQN